MDVNEEGRLSTVIECFLPIPRFTKNYVGRRRMNNDNDTGGKVIKKGNPLAVAFPMSSRP